MHKISRKQKEGGYLQWGLHCDARLPSHYDAQDMKIDNPSFSLDDRSHLPNRRYAMTGSSDRHFIVSLMITAWSNIVRCIPEIDQGLGRVWYMLAPNVFGWHCRHFTHGLSVRSANGSLEQLQTYVAAHFVVRFAAHGSPRECHLSRHQSRLIRSKSIPTVK